MTTVTPGRPYLQRLSIRDVVHHERTVQDAEFGGGLAPGIEVRGLQVAFERRVVGPEFAHANEAWVVRVDGDVVGDAAVVGARGVDEGFEVREHGGDVFRREAEGAENGDGGGHI